MRDARRNPAIRHAHRLVQRIARLVERGQEPSQLLAQLPVFLAHGAAQQPHALLRRGGELVECVQNEQIATGRLERAALQGLFEKLLWWGQVVEQGAPGADFGLARTLDNDVKVALE